MQSLVALGANLSFGASSPDQIVMDAVNCLCNSVIKVKARSRLFKTPAFPKGAGPDYVNAAVMLDIAGDPDPHGLLQQLHAVEAQFGRQRETRWGTRTIDIDLLAVGGLVLPDAITQSHWRTLPADDQLRLTPQHLILPHPRLQDRAFVLVPLADIAPDWVHPLLNRSVQQMLDALSPADRAEVRAIPDPT